jgi:hypothetical protein
MCKYCIIKCFPDKRTILRCCCFDLTYYKIFALQTIFTVSFHFFDIGSDIAVLIDLKNNESEYFTLCLIIILLPVIATFIKSLITIRRGVSCKCFATLIYFTFFNVILQCNFFYSAFQNLRQGRKTRPFVETRIQESLLESAPESLFQLFIILKNATTYTYYQITIYYLSIILSIFSLIMSLVSYEIFLFNDIRRGEIIRNIIRATDYSIPFDITEKPIKSNNRYIILLTFYRLTEVLSRVGLLACIGNIYDGYLIIWFLLADFLLSCLLNSYRVILNCEICEYESDDDKGTVCGCPFQVMVSLLFYKLFNRLKNLAVFSNYFLNIISLDCMTDEGYSINGIIDKRDYFLDIKYHFISRYLNNLIMSVLIMYNILINTYSYSLFIISIISICLFVLNIPLLYFIIKYSYNYKKYQYIFKPIEFCKCDCSKDIKDEIDEKHPDDVII